MAQLNPLNLTMLGNTDARQLRSSAIKLVPIIGPIYSKPSPMQLLNYCAAYAVINRKLKSVDYNTMTITLNNNGIIEHWLCCALYSNNEGKTEIVLMLIGNEALQK
ncbi:hypothetical protein AB4254_10815 [Vibrio breoganii]